MPSSSLLAVNVVGYATSPTDGTVRREDLPPVFTAYFGSYFGADDQVFRAVQSFAPPNGRVLVFSRPSRHFAVRILTPGITTTCYWETDLGIPPNPPLIQANSHHLVSGQFLIVTNVHDNGSYQMLIDCAVPFDAEITTFGSP